ncbi:cupredoxin domain-containing protein [Natronorubrum sp. FCH18a]|uniref:cupredoxin domain-containing protein n=1 Tax=Natronorubrum sp. FCH18a TaxID=3447018 RepID=UPI003F50F335
MDRERLSRRRLLAVAATGSVLSATLAGCLGEDDVETDDVDENGEDGDDDEGIVEIITRAGEEDEDEPNFVFDPDHVEIEPGTTVRWVNTDGVFHTVTATDSLEEKSPSEVFSETLSSDGDEFEWTPEDEGVQHYYCEPHAGFMEGTIEIGDVDAAEPEKNEDDADEDTTDVNDDTEIDEEFVDMTGEDSIQIETRKGDAEDEPNFVFDPAFVRIDAGTTVEWVNTDGVFHTVTSTDSIDTRSGGGDEFDETLSSEGDSFEWDADETGTQPYYCSPHAGFMYGALEIE